MSSVNPLRPTCWSTGTRLSCSASDGCDNPVKRVKAVVLGQSPGRKKGVKTLAGHARLNRPLPSNDRARYRRMAKFT